MSTIESLRKKLEDNGCYDTGREEGRKKIKSGYFDRQTRRDVYKKWLEGSQVGEARPDSSQNNSEDVRAEESLTRLVSYALKSLGESVHKSLTDCLLLKSRSGVYQDNAENRRLHRVGQHYGNDVRSSFNKETVSRTSTVEQFRAKAEKFLSSMKGVDFRYVDSSTTNGASVYFKVSRKDGKGDTLKFRISDHSVTNRDRVMDEVHYSNSDPEQTRNEIYYRLGFPGYKYGKTIVTMPSGRKLEAFGYYKEEDIV